MTVCYPPRLWRKLDFLHKSIDHHKPSPAGEGVIRVILECAPTRFFTPFENDTWGRAKDLANDG